MHHHPWQLSGGMQQRVALARALAYRPRLLLMDEPFASVDAQTRVDLEELLLDVQARYGITIVFVTHDIDESIYLADRVPSCRPDRLSYARSSRSTSPAHAARSRRSRRSAMQSCVHT